MDEYRTLNQRFRRVNKTFTIKQEIYKSEHVTKRHDGSMFQCFVHVETKLNNLKLPVLLRDNYLFFKKNIRNKGVHKTKQ